MEINIHWRQFLSARSINDVSMNKTFGNTCLKAFYLNQKLLTQEKAFKSLAS